MAEHRGRAAAVTVLCLLAAGLVTGCDGDNAAEEPAAAPSSPPATHADREVAIGTDGSSTASALADRRCVRAERNAVGWDWTWRAVDEVAGSASGRSNRALASVERYVANTRAHLEKKCGDTSPQAFMDFSREIRRILVTDSFGDPQLHRALAAWLRWGEAVGEPKTARRTIQEVRSCRNLFTRFDATYRTWWRWTSAGKAWWIDITFDNRTGRPLGGESWGQAKATGRLQDSYGWESAPEPGPGEDVTLQWGASSLDSFSSPTGTSVWRVAPDADWDVHTTADGNVEVTEATLSLRPGNGSYDCNAPVLPEL